MYGRSRHNPRHQQDDTDTDGSMEDAG